MKLDNRGAIYIPFAQAIPNVAVIDPSSAESSRPASAACAKRCAPRAR